MSPVAVVTTWPGDHALVDARVWRGRACPTGDPLPALVGQIVTRWLTVWATMDEAVPFPVREETWDLG